ncbi:MAG: hypothetical protein ACK5ML_00350 [Lachnospiraceae bacterium]
MHAAIDVVIRNNHIHNCTRGIWLDWQVQGTRVSNNLFYDNCLPYEFVLSRGTFSAIGEDLFIEVSHGPTLVDHNIMLSDRALKICAQGIALVHNLIHGSITSVGIGTDNGSKDIPSPRYTPYHQIHGTRVEGFMTILHGDVRIYNNIFVQKKIRPTMKAVSDIVSKDGNGWDDCNMIAGSFVYNGYPTFQEWDAKFEGYCGIGSKSDDKYYDHLPVWMSGNQYFNGARPWEKEADAAVNSENEIRIELYKKDDSMYLNTNLYEFLTDAGCGIISTENLGMAFEPEEKFEHPDGSPIVLIQDYWGRSRSAWTYAGPFAVPDQIQNHPITK